MYLSRAIGIDLKGEKLLGLIDGTHAIVLTLLVIELPALIIEATGNAGNISTLAFILATDLVGYLVAAVIIFDMWSLLKATIDSTKASSIQSLTCITMLWLSSLVPVFFYLTERFTQETFANSHGLEAKIGSPEVLLFRTILLAIIGLNYFLNFLYLNKKAIHMIPGEAQYVRQLTRLRCISLTTITALSLLVSLIFEITYALLPLILFVPFLFLSPKTTKPKSN